MKLEDFEKLQEQVKDQVFCLWAREEFKEVDKANEFLRHLRDDKCIECFEYMTRKFKVFIEVNCELDESKMN